MCIFVDFGLRKSVAEMTLEFKDCKDIVRNAVGNKLRSWSIGNSRRAVEAARVADAHCQGRIERMYLTYVNECNLRICWSVSLPFPIIANRQRCG